MVIREVRLPQDTDPILAIDRSFVSERVYHINRTAWSFALDDVPVHPPLRKEWPLNEHDLGEGRSWEQGLVAEHEGALVGFIAFSHRPWNRRTEIWHLYVAPVARGRGVGRALVEAVISAGRTAAMRCVWLESSNLAYPAIHFYQHMGFTLSGLDISLYDPQGKEPAETALYFSYPLGDGDHTEMKAGIER